MLPYGEQRCFVMTSAAAVMSPNKILSPFGTMWREWWRLYDFSVIQMHIGVSFFGCSTPRMAVDVPSLKVAYLLFDRIAFPVRARNVKALPAFLLVTIGFKLPGNCVCMCAIGVEEFTVG